MTTTNLASALCQLVVYHDGRAVFSRQQDDARVALQSWHFDADAAAASLPGPPSPSRTRDLGSLSEAIRYAALVYTLSASGAEHAIQPREIQNPVTTLRDSTPGARQTSFFFGPSLLSNHNATNCNNRLSGASVVASSVGSDKCAW